MSSEIVRRPGREQVLRDFECSVQLSRQYHWEHP